MGGCPITLRVEGHRGMIMLRIEAVLKREAALEALRDSRYPRTFVLVTFLNDLVCIQTLICCRLHIAVRHEVRAVRAVSRNTSFGLSFPE